MNIDIVIHSVKEWISIDLKLDSLRTVLPWIETEDCLSTAAVQRLAEGPVGPNILGRAAIAAGQAVARAQ